jgi:hypothetical protein
MSARIAILAALTLLAGCSKAPRSASYFESHRDEANRVLAACREGSERGDECVNAQAGPAAASRDARMQMYRKAF